MVPILFLIAIIYKFIVIFQWYLCKALYFFKFHFILFGRQRSRERDCPSAGPHTKSQQQLGQGQKHILLLPEDWQETKYLCSFHMPVLVHVSRNAADFKQELGCTKQAFLAASYELLSPVPQGRHFKAFKKKTTKA